MSDTLIDRYFYSDLSGVGDSSYSFYPGNVIQNEIIHERIKSEAPFEDAAYSNWNNYDHTSEISIIVLLVAIIYFSFILSSIILIIISTLRFMGVRVFFLGLIMPLVAFGLLLLAVYFKISYINPNYSLGLFLLFALLIIFIVLLGIIKRNTKWRLALVQFSIYIILFLIMVLPIIISNGWRHTFFLWRYAILMTSPVLLFLIATLYLNKVYKLYSVPAE